MRTWKKLSIRNLSSCKQKYAMESWHGLNYYTDDPSTHILLMNLSTREWNVGWFPPNFIAIKGALSDVNTSALLPDALVISMPDSTTSTNTPAIDAVVFGSTAGFVLVFVVAQLIWSWKSGTLLRPRQARAIDSTNTATSDDAEDSQIQPASAAQPRDGSGNDLSLGHFKRILGEYYFEPMATELEPCSHLTTTTPGGRPRTGDIGKAVRLAREAISIEAQLRSLRGQGEGEAETSTKLGQRKKIILDKIRDDVQKWDGHGQTWWWNRWLRKSQERSPAEKKRMDDVKGLVHRLATPRPTQYGQPGYLPHLENGAYGFAVYLGLY